MKTINGTTRIVHLKDDYVEKVPKEGAFEMGVQANLAEIECIRAFPNFCAPLIECLSDGTKNKQQRLKLLPEHDNFKLYAEAVKKWEVSKKYCIPNQIFRFDPKLRDDCRFKAYFSRKWTKKVLLDSGFGVHIPSDLRHDFFEDTNYGITNNGKIVLVDLGNPSLKFVLQKHGNEIFAVLNEAIQSGNKYINV